MATRSRQSPPQVGIRDGLRAPMSDVQLDLFYRRVFLPLVRRATWKHRLPKEDACDVVQDAFVLALSKLDSTKNPNAWLVQVVDNLALNHRRKVLRRAALAQRWQPRDGCSGDRQETNATDD
jgi:DNA-directed RNA polymerase specialized sigma24 family protein